MSFQEDNHYDRKMFFNELSQIIERKKLSTNILFKNYLDDFKDIVQHNGLIEEEMNIICQVLCQVDLSVKNFQRILLTLVPEEPLIPSNICEELIIWALSVYRQNNNDESKAYYLLYWLLYVIEEKLTDLDVIDKYYKVLFYLCNYETLNQPVAGIIYNLTKIDDVQNWMILRCQNIIEGSKSQTFVEKLQNFFKNPNLIQETHVKGLFDSNVRFCKELAFGLRSVRKELININPTQSQQLVEYRRKSLSIGLTRSKIQLVNDHKKFELPSAENLAKAFMGQSPFNTSLTYLSSISGWCKILMDTNKDLNLQHRFSNNLYYNLDQIFLSRQVNWTPKRKTIFLNEILEFQKFALRGLVAVNRFIYEFIISWDGMEYARIIYGLFEQLSFTSEEELESRFLEKLFAIFITGDELIYRMVINSLTNLLCNLHLNSRQTRSNKDSVLFGEKLRGDTEFEIIKCLTKHISQWCSICIFHYPQEEQLKHTVYTFYEKVSVLENLEPHVWPLWTITPPNVFYNGLMSINIYWLERLAQLMLRHINYDLKRVEDKLGVPWIVNSLNMFELFMADFYNAFYAGKLFEKREEGFIFRNLNEEEIQKDLKMVNLNICFQMEKHIALSPYYMNIENKNKDPLDILTTVAPNLHNLIFKLNERLFNESENE